jgi:hypothetical protein
MPTTRTGLMIHSSMPRTRRRRIAAAATGGSDDPPTTTPPQDLSPSSRESSEEPETDTASADADVEYVVKELLDRRSNADDGTTEYLVLWDGYPRSQATWEGAAELPKHHGHILAYGRKHLPGGGQVLDVSCCLCARLPCAATGVLRQNWCAGGVLRHTGGGTCDAQATGTLGRSCCTDRGVHVLTVVCSMPMGAGVGRVLLCVSSVFSVLRQVCGRCAGVLLRAGRYMPWWGDHR